MILHRQEANAVSKPLVFFREKDRLARGQLPILENQYRKEVVGPAVMIQQAADSDLTGAVKAENARSQLQFKLFQIHKDSFL